MDSGVWMWAWSAVGGARLARVELRQCGRDLSVMTVRSGQGTAGEGGAKTVWA